MKLSKQDLNLLLGEFFTTTFHPTEPYGAHENSGEKMPKDDVFSEQKPLYVVKPIRNYLYVAIRDAEAVGSSPVTSTTKMTENRGSSSTFGHFLYLFKVSARHF